MQLPQVEQPARGLQEISDGPDPGFSKHGFLFIEYGVEEHRAGFVFAANGVAIIARRSYPSPHAIAGQQMTNTEQVAVTQLAEFQNIALVETGGFVAAHHRQAEYPCLQFIRSEEGHDPLDLFRILFLGRSRCPPPRRWRGSST